RHDYDQDRERHHRHRSWSASPDRSRETSRSRSKSKRISGFDMGPPTGATFPGTPVTATGYISTAGEVQRKYSNSLLQLVVKLLLLVLVTTARRVSAVRV
ncbi:hypothetical protein Tco_1048077, partial [Tanacetum coccineum]